MGFPVDPTPSDNWNTGTLDPGTGGVRDGYTPDDSAMARAEYDARLDEEAAVAKRGPLARLRHFLRRLFWEF